MARNLPSPATRVLAVSLAGLLTLGVGSPRLAWSAPDADTPDAGDADIPDDTLEPGQLGKANRGPTNAPTRTASTVVIPGSKEQGYLLAEQADLAFDDENYGEAVRLYGQVLKSVPENQTNHVFRAVVLANAVTALEQLHAIHHNLDHLRQAEALIHSYLRECRTKHGTSGCDRQPETQDVRTRLKFLQDTIQAEIPPRPKLPPEIGTAPGGKPYDLTVKLPPAPEWIAPVIVGGILLAGGGVAVAYHAAHANRYGPLYPRSFDDGTGIDPGTDPGGDTGGNPDGGIGQTPTAPAAELSPATKGKMLLGLGAFMAAAGVGLVVLASLRLAKHRRLNRERAQTLAVTPSFAPGLGPGPGLSVTGRF